MAFALAVQAQTVSVSGTVSDADGPLLGVSIIVKGTSTGTATDFDGNYTLNNVPINATLVYTYLGYVDQEIVVDGRSIINVTMQPDLEELSEVVVVGYGTMERSNVTGAITTVNAEDIEKVEVPNAVEALRGQVSGLRITRGSGEPGSGVNFTIRGTNSLGEGSASIADANQPIIVVDGVPLPGNINEINPDDIESVNIIKDAGAGAIYGSQAANGVILITTKSGKAGKPTITVNASSAINEVGSRVNIMNGDEYVKYLLDSGQGTDLSGALHPNEYENYIAGRSVDWQDEILRQGFTTHANLSVSGGTEQLSFYMNGDMYRETGIVTASDYNRYSFRFNGEYRPTDRFKIGARVQYTLSDADETSTRSITDFNVNGGFAPFIPIFTNTPLGDLYNEDGSYAKFITDDQFQVNPFHRYNESIVDRKINRTYINPYIEYKIFNGLTYTLNTFAEGRNEFFGRFTSSDYIDGDPSTAQIQKTNSVNYLVDNILNYKKDFGKHSIDATFVYGFQKDEWERMDAFSDKLATDLLGYHAIDDTATDDQRIAWDTDESGRVYYVGRVSYGFDNRYIITGTLRRDGSSKFVDDNRWGTFPSVSGAWNVHNEPFWGDGSFMDFLKLRVSYGTLGNDRIGTYRYLSNPNVVRSTILVDQDGDPNTIEDVVEENIVGYSKGSLGNPYLKWETSKQFNIGLDFGLFNNRLTSTIDVYNTKTSDLLLPQLIPIINGYTSYITNIGETENRGVEVTLKGSIIQTEDFVWDAAINWATNRNEIVRLNQVDANGNPQDDPANGWWIGQSIDVLYGYKFIGIWQTEEADEAASYGQVPGDAKFLDVNDDGAITPGEDRVFLGNQNTPDWYGGITNTLTFKGFQLSALVEVVEGLTKINNFYGTYTGRGNQVAVDYWTPDNPSNRFPRAGSPDWSGIRGNAVKTQDASFVALRNISLTYNFSRELLGDSTVKGLSIYARGNNLKYWTDFDNSYSPEVGIGSYPIIRTWTFGASITF
ncbi:TonB-dependent receptor [Mangrovimonas sp. TPBH4]|uniref:SusC/RagA family TonB-linked outer membrane protein n=1 Tax=Mangrovimonas sp. TPBH4 TaxID=1645914 RepID=UPI0006B5B355|nr:TonB-dependent receptor [Mangrovimonas sp. TPBH4]